MIDLDQELIPLVPTKSSGQNRTVVGMTGKKPETVLNWVRGRTKRVLPAVKIGGSWYTTKQSLEAFMCTVVTKEPKCSSGHLAAVASLKARLSRNESRASQRKKLLPRSQ